MAYDIGPKIGIDGEAEFRKAINNINTNIRTLGTEMLAVTSAYDANDKSAAALTSRNEVLVKQIDAQKEKLAKLQEGLEASAGKYGENDEKTQRWQQTVNKATAELNQMERQLAKNTRELDQADAGANEAGDSMEDLGAAAERASGKLSTMTVAMGNLLADGIKAAVAGVKNLVNAVWSLDGATAEYREAQGKLNTAFEAAGRSSEAAQQAYSDFYRILGDTDTAAEASQLLAQLADNEQDMSRWTNIAAGVAGTFGDALPINGLIEAANETAKVGQVTGALADALNWVSISEDAFNEQLAACGTESERNQMIMETLSNAYSGAADSFYRNNAAIVQAREGQALLDRTMAGLGETISNVKNGLRAEFLPAIAEMADGLSALISGDKAGLKNISQGLDMFSSSLSEVLPRVLETGSQIVQSLLGAITENLPQVINAGAGVLLELVNGIMGMLPQITASALAVITTLSSGIASSLPELIPTAADVLLQIVETLTDPDNLENVINAALKIIVSLAEGLIKAIPEIVEKVPQIIKNLVTALVAEIPQITAAALELIAALGSGLIVAIPQMLTQIPQIIAAIVGGLVGGISDIKKVGGQIVEGLWEGIKAMGSWIKEKVSGFFSGIVDSVKGLLGIHSPSKVFAGIGGYMAEGLGQGFGDELGTVQRNIRRSMAELAGNASGTVRMETVPAGGGFGGSGGTDMDLVSILVAAIQQALAGMGIYLDGRRVGQLIATLLSNDNKAWGR